MLLYQPNRPITDQFDDTALVNFLAGFLSGLTVKRYAAFRDQGLSP